MDRRTYAINSHDDLLRQASDPATAPDLLRLWAGAEFEDDVHAAVAGNPNTPKEVLFALIPDFPEQFLANPVLPLLLMEQPDLAWRLPVTAQKALLRCVDLPLALLHPLAKPPEARYRPFGPQWIIPELAAQHVLLAGEAPDAAWPPKALALLEREVKNGHMWQKPYSWEGCATLPDLLPPWYIEHVLANERYEYMPLPPDLTVEQIRAMATNERQVHRLTHVPQTSPLVLRTLSTHATSGIRHLVARHPNTPPDVLENVSADAAWAIRRDIAHHPHTPPAALARLAGDSVWGVRLAVAKHPRTPPAALAQLAQDAEWRVRACVAANRHTPLSLLEVCAADPQAEVRTLVARNPCAPTRLLEDLAAQGEAAAAWALAHRRRMGHVAAGDFADALARRDFDLLRDLARDAHAPGDVLATLAHHEDCRVRQVVAQNRQTPVAALRELANDADERVRQAGAANTRTPLDALEILAAPTQSEHVRLALARNPNVPFDLLARLVEGASYHICHAVVHHQHVGKSRRGEIYRRFFTWALEHDAADGFVRSMALAGIELPAAIFARAARSHEWAERLLMTRNPHIPTAVLETLTNDGDRYVRASARTALAERAM